LNNGLAAEFLADDLKPAGPAKALYQLLPHAVNVAQYSILVYQK